MNKEKLVGNLLLLLTAIIWGLGFVAQRVGMDYVGPLTFGAARFMLAALVLIPVIHLMEKRDNQNQQSEQVEYTAKKSGTLLPEDIDERKTLIKAGIICGIVLFCGSTFQQFGLVFTTAGKAAFITALYIILVPIFSLFLRRSPGIKCWVGAAIGAAGLYFLCITESFTIAPGDLIVLIGAGFWAVHLLVIDHFMRRKVDAVKLSFMQFSVCAFFSTIGALIFEEISINAILQCAIPILYAGALSGGVGFTLQVIAQKHTNPTVASLLLSMEAVFGAIFGFLLLKEIMTSRELVGCILMFSAIIISQLPDKRRS
ncbi:MAG: DMT family transporter [Eubacteriales bacterium]|nr:DMT family transporter [Eubacteriales bacterium]MDD4629790.1 DMT family transporter [Eubacteriales bacterium]